MKKFFLSIVLLATGLTTAHGQMGPETGECPQLMLIESMIRLTDEQRVEMRNLSQEFSKELAEQIEKIREELSRRYGERGVGKLDDQQKQQFQALFASETKLVEASRSADSTYRDTLLELFTNEQTAEHVRTRIKETPVPPQNKKQLVDMLALTDGALQQKLTPLMVAQAQEQARVSGGASTVDWRNPAEVQKWREESAKQREELENKFIEDSIALMSDEQKALFAKAVEALEEWQTGRSVAEEAYLESAGETLGDGADLRRLQMRARMLMREPLTRRPFARPDQTR